PSRFFAVEWLLAVVLALGCGGEAAAPAVPAFRLVTVAGDRQEASVCAAVPVAPAIRFDRDGTPQPGVAVRFRVTAGGGSVTGGEASTDAAGIATVGSWTLGVSLGT